MPVCVVCVSVFSSSGVTRARLRLQSIDKGSGRYKAISKARVDTGRRRHVARPVSGLPDQVRSPEIMVDIVGLYLSRRIGATGLFRWLNPTFLQGPENGPNRPCEVEKHNRGAKSAEASQRDSILLEMERLMMAE